MGRPHDDVQLHQSGHAQRHRDPFKPQDQFGWCGAQFDQLRLMTDPTGHTTSYQNDSLGRKTQETDPLGNVTKYTYDAAGHLLTTTKTRVVNGQTETLTTTNTVDADGNILSTTDALGHVTQSTWTPLKQLATQTDRARPDNELQLRPDRTADQDDLSGRYDRVDRLRPERQRNQPDRPRRTGHKDRLR